jgi:hypothetical protein
MLIASAAKLGGGGGGGGGDLKYLHGEVCAFLIQEEGKTIE